jgi:hypothetical protein
MELSSCSVERYDFIHNLCISIRRTSLYDKVHLSRNLLRIFRVREMMTNLWSVVIADFLVWALKIT